MRAAAFYPTIGCDCLPLLIKTQEALSNGNKSYLAKLCVCLLIYLLTEGLGTLVFQEGSAPAALRSIKSDSNLYLELNFSHSYANNRDWAW